MERAPIGFAIGIPPPKAQPPAQQGEVRPERRRSRQRRGGPTRPAAHSGEPPAKGEVRQRRRHRRETERVGKAGSGCYLGNFIKNPL